MKTGAARLRELIQRVSPPVVPLVLDPIRAKLAQGAGFEALYLGGGTLGYVKTCTEANLTLTLLCVTTARHSTGWWIAELEKLRIHWLKSLVAAV